MMVRLFLWIVFIYVIYRLIRSSIQSAVNRGIKDYEVRKEARERKDKEVKIDRKNVEDAKFKDLP